MNKASIALYCILFGFLSTTSYAQLRITEICPRPTAFDANGKESGWIELYNEGEEAVDLANYEILRANRGKKASPGAASKNLASRMVAPGTYTLIYTSEEYPNVDSGLVDIYDHDLMVYPSKVNPKKYPYIVLYRGADAASKVVVDSFIIPEDLADGCSFAPFGNGAERDTYVANDSSEDDPDAPATIAMETPRFAAGRVTIPAADVTLSGGVVLDDWHLDSATSPVKRGVWDFASVTTKNVGVQLAPSITEQLSGHAYTVAMRFRADVNNAEATHDMPLFECRPSSNDGRHGMILAIDDAGQLYVQPRSGGSDVHDVTVDSDVNYVDGQWHHVVLVAGPHTTDRLAIWVDGVKYVDRAMPLEADLRADMPICIGHSYNSSYWNLFQGQISDLRLYSRGLSDAEAQTLATETLTEREISDFGGGLVPGGTDPANVTQTGDRFLFNGAPSLNAKSTYLANAEAVAAGTGTGHGDRDFVTTGETIDFWVKRDATPGNGKEAITLMDTRATAGSSLGYLLLCGTTVYPNEIWIQNSDYVDGEIRYALRFGAEIPTDEWMHVTLAVDVANPAGGAYCNASATLYTNGIAVSTQPFPTYLPATTQRRFGGSYDNWWNSFRGEMGSIRTFSGALSAREIALLHNEACANYGLPEAEIATSADIGSLVDPGAEFDLQHPENVIRCILPTPTPGYANSLLGAIPYGPNVGPLYGIKHSACDWSAFPVAVPDEDYTVTVAANPLSADPADAITALTLVYRTDFGTEKTLPMTRGTTDAKAQGQLWSATIPASDLPAPGHLLRWSFRITDASANTWRSPSFRNPDNSYEWYGTIVSPLAEQLSATLPTFHLFSDATNLSLMDLQYDNIAGSNPCGARIGIYDSASGLYYDNVRIDLRGHTTAGFRKKSHALRFNKSQPLTCTNPFDGEKIEIRKTSFTAEYADPAYIRQALSFYAHRLEGSLAPFCYPVRLQLNGEFFQLAFHSNRFTDELIEDYYGLDPYGYAYKNAGTCGSGTTAGNTEKKTPDDGRENDLSVFNNELCNPLKWLVYDNINETYTEDGTNCEVPALTREVVRRFDLPAWLNYLAVSHTVQETDDVWANLCVYYDANNTATWRPLTYDVHLSWGAYYNNGNRFSIPGIHADWDDFKSHPLYGGMRIRCYDLNHNMHDNGNVPFEAIFQSNKFRRLYLRRLRTVMDDLLGAPGTAQADTPTWEYVMTLRDAIADDAALDTAKWGYAKGTVMYPWDTNLDLDAGIADLWDNFIVPRRTHLYVTHSATNTTRTIGYASDLIAGIPESQAPTTELRDGFSLVNALPEGGFADPTALVISNANPVAVDMSGWVLQGAVRWTLPAGTVIDANDTLTIVPNRAAYITAHANELTDQIIVGNAPFATDTSTALILNDANGVNVLTSAPPTDESHYLRLAAFCGITADGIGGDTGEFIVLTNLSDSVSLDLAGVRVLFVKDGDDPATAKCNVLLDAGTIPPLGSLRLDQATTGWEKITNNKIVFTLSDRYGLTCQTGAATQKDFPTVYGSGDFGGGAYLIATSTAPALKKSHWRASYELPTDATGATAVREGIAASAPLGRWLNDLAATPEGTTALAAYAGDTATLQQCYLVNALPDSDPQIRLHIDAIHLAPDQSSTTLNASLSVHNQPHTHPINGSLSILCYEELTSTPTKLPTSINSFPTSLQVNTLSETYHFFKLVIE